MAIRSAEQAGLNDPPERDPVRPRTGENDAKTVAPHDELDVLNFLPIPAINHLQIHGWDDYTTTINLNPIQKTKWEDENGAKVLAYKAYGGKIEEREEIIKLRDLIKVAIKVNTNPIVTAPIPETTKGKRDPYPPCALVKGLTPEKAQELIDKARSPCLTYKTTR